MRRTAAILATTGVLGLGFLPSASAQAPEVSYSAGSSATALEIALVGQGLAVSHTTAGVTSTPVPTAKANGAALLLAGNPIPGDAPVEATEGEDVTDSTSACPVDLSALTEALAGTNLTIDVACTTTNAKVASGAPSARAESGEVVIRLNGLDEGALAPLGDALEQVLGEALPQGSSVVEQLCTVLAPLCSGVDETLGIDIPGLVDEIFGALGEIGNGDFTLAEIFVAPTLSTASASEDGVVAAAGSGAVTINLFPGVAAAIEEVTGLLETDPAETQGLLRLQLAQATATVERDASTGEASPDASAAQLLSVELTDSLGVLSELLSVELPGVLDSLAEAGAALSCADGALADVICIDLGSVNELDEAELAARGYDFGDGTVGREATAASVHVLPILSTTPAAAPLLSLALAEASAAANAAPAQPLPGPAPEEPTARGPLPKTGTDAQLPVALGLLAVAGLGVAALRRTRTI
ncbi:MAG: LPXTG cell wall anchor domain-containing protein [Acidimicrobiia bacterium]